jgi:PKD repeat protein
VQFQDMSFDPAQLGIASQAWDFGEGTTGSGAFPTHRYAADGVYTVGLTVATHDGRTACTSQILRVKTHDVAITRFSVPNSAKAGQTREITAGVRNSLTPENVQFQLLKGVPGSGAFQLVGTLTQLVPVSNGSKTVPVTMSYTFSQDDAAVGKVTFQIVTQVPGGRDAIPADNTAISSPTKVNP